MEIFGKIFYLSDYPWPMNELQKNIKTELANSGGLQCLENQVGLIDQNTFDRISLNTIIGILCPGDVLGWIP